MILESHLNDGLNFYTIIDVATILITSLADLVAKWVKTSLNARMQLVPCFFTFPTVWGQIK